KASTSGAPNTSTAQISQLIALAPPSSACPPNAFQPNGTDCTDDGNPCTTDTCSAGACSHAAGNAGTVCRAAAGVCDVDETCTGTSTACPANAFEPSTTACRASAGEGDPAEHSAGSSATCPGDANDPAGTACTDDGNPCSRDECDGTHDACQHPAGNAGAVCRAAAGVCDVDETCTGTSTACPAHAFEPSTTVCRASRAEA